MNEVVIGRVRIRARDLTGLDRHEVARPVRSSVDPLLLRLRAAHLLETADLTPPGLPPGAILTIRRLVDPLPGRLSLDAPQLAPDRAWQAALTGRLAALAARAERPLVQAVGAGAEAVLFADPGEMLACLALDWLAGQLLNRWWWREVVRNRQLDASVIGAWLEAVDAAPAALGHLNQRGEAVSFLRKLDDDSAAQLLTGLVERHRLTGLREAVAASVRSRAPGAGGGAPGMMGGGAGRQSETGSLERPAGSAPEGPASRESDRGRFGAAEGGLAAAPWAGLVAADTANLSPARQMLLGVGLGLAYAPYAVRGEAYGQQALRWAYGGPAEAAEPPVLPPKPRYAGLVAGARAEQAQHEQTDLAAPGAARADEARGDSASRDERRSDAGSAGVDPRNERELDASGETGPEATTEQPQQGEAPGVQVDMSPLEAPQEAQAPPAAQAAAQFAPAPLAEQLDEALEAVEVRTEYAGLFYLVNVALGMGFYADFTLADAEGELALSPWAFVALIGRALVGGGLATDPVWPLLGRLAGVEGEVDAADRLAAEFVPPNGLSVPEWVERTAEQVYEWIAVRFPERPADHAALADIAFVRAGRVRASAGRLDVTLRLDDLDIAVRLAGLDRNPGWVPAAGRTIAFHYE